MLRVDMHMRDDDDMLASALRSQQLRAIHKAHERPHSSVCVCFCVCVCSCLSVSVSVSVSLVPVSACVYAHESQQTSVSMRAQAYACVRLKYVCCCDVGVCAVVTTLSFFPFELKELHACSKGSKHRNHRGGRRGREERRDQEVNWHGCTFRQPHSCTATQSHRHTWALLFFSVSLTLRRCALRSACTFLRLAAFISSVSLGCA